MPAAAVLWFPSSLFSEFCYSRVELLVFYSFRPSPSLRCEHLILLLCRPQRAWHIYHRTAVPLVPHVHPQLALAVCLTSLVCANSTGVVELLGCYCCTAQQLAVLVQSTTYCCCAAAAVRTSTTKKEEVDILFHFSVAFVISRNTN